MNNESQYPDHKTIEKNLVVEQPGFITGFIGLVMALLIGFAIRSLFSPDKILELVDKAAAKVDSRFVARVGAAHISLADGIFPEIAIVVEDVTLESEEICWMRPVVEVDKLKLPLDLFKFLTGTIHIHEIDAHEINLSLRSDLTKCQEQQKHTVLDVKRNDLLEVIPNRLPTTTTDWEKLPHSRNAIDEVNIDILKIHYLPIIFSTFEVRNLNVSVTSQSPKKISSEGVLVLSGETLSGDYSSTAQLSVNFDESRNPMWNLLIDGSWREGNYNLQIAYEPKNQNISLNIDLAHLPLNQILPMLRKYQIVKTNYNGKQIWLTLNSKISGKANELDKLPIEIKKIKVEGDIGEISSENIKISKISPFTYEPVDLDIQSLNFNKLFVFLNKAHPSASLGDLGRFHGQAKIYSDEQVNLKGEHSGLEFIFSSRGHKQVQSISMISGELNYKNNQWEVNINRIKPAEGVFLGHIRLWANRDWKDLNIDVHIDDLSVGPQVQKLITNGGEIGTLNGDVQMRFSQGEMDSINGSISTTGVILNQTLIKRSLYQISTGTSKAQGAVQGAMQGTMQGTETLINTQLQGLKFTKGSEPFQLMTQFMAAPPQSDFELNLLSGQFRTHSLKDMIWKNVIMIGNRFSFTSSGGWTEKGELFGSIKVKQSIIGDLKSKKYIQNNLRYEIKGRRDLPLFDQVVK